MSGESTCKDITKILYDGTANVVTVTYISGVDNIERKTIQPGLGRTGRVLVFYTAPLGANRAKYFTIAGEMEDPFTVKDDDLRKIEIDGEVVFHQ